MELFKEAEVVLKKLNELCPWAADDRTRFLELFSTTVCAEKLPSQLTKDQLFEYSIYYGTAIREVYKDSKDIVVIDYLLQWLTSLLSQGAGIKCGV